MYNGGRASVRVCVGYRMDCRSRPRPKRYGSLSYGRGGTEPKRIEVVYYGRLRAGWRAIQVGKGGLHEHRQLYRKTSGDRAQMVRH